MTLAEQALEQMNNHVRSAIAGPAQGAMPIAVVLAEYKRDADGNAYIPGGGQIYVLWHDGTPEDAKKKIVAHAAMSYAQSSVRHQKHTDMDFPEDRS